MQEAEARPVICDGSCGLGNLGVRRAGTRSRLDHGRGSSSAAMQAIRDIDKWQAGAEWRQGAGRVLCPIWRGEWQDSKCSWSESEGAASRCVSRTVLGSRPGSGPGQVWSWG